MTEATREKFAALAAAEDDSIRLDEAALLIAAEAEPALSVEQYLAELDGLARKFGAAAGPHSPPDRLATRLVRFIHEEEGFSGNITNYYDPGNSYLNRVIDLHQGIPITLALIHIAMGDRLEIPVQGISFPGHFLVRYGGETGPVVDPFSGRELSRADCQNLLRQLAGPRATLQDEYFAPATKRELLIRLLDNLKQIFWHRKAWDESKACLDRQLLLLPNRTEFNVQLGAVYEMQGNTAMARHTYIRALQEAPDEQLRDLAGKRLLALESGGKLLH